jgi:hypothetical protein
MLLVGLGKTRISTDYAQRFLWRLNLGIPIRLGILCWRKHGVVKWNLKVS